MLGPTQPKKLTFCNSPVSHHHVLILTPKQVPNTFWTFIYDLHIFWWNSRKTYWIYHANLYWTFFRKGTTIYVYLIFTLLFFRSKRSVFCHKWAKKSWVTCFGLKIVAWHSNVNSFVELKVKYLQASYKGKRNLQVFFHLFTNIGFFDRK